MKRIVLGFALCLMFLLSNLGANAQQKTMTSDDASTVRETVRNYIEGYYTGDAHRLAATLHPHYLKHMSLRGWMQMSSPFPVAQPTSTCSSVCASAIENSATLVRRKDSRCAPQPSALPKSCATERMYGTIQIPETYIIDRDGVLRRKFANAFDWSTPEVTDFLSKL